LSSIWFPEGRSQSAKSCDTIGYAPRTTLAFSLRQANGDGFAHEVSW
jgi:hypothetical protein